MSTTIAPPSQHQLRAKLEAMVVRDLLGPGDNPNEELTERSVRERYLVGILAPSRKSPDDQSTVPGSRTTVPAPDEDDADDDPEINDELSEGGSDSIDDGTTDIDAAQAHRRASLCHGFHDGRQGLRFTISEPARREVLQRLLKLNHERYAEEVRQGLHGKKGAAGKAAPKKKTASKPAQQETTLFGDEDD